VRNSSGKKAGSFNVYFNISKDPTIIPVSGLAASVTAEVRMTLQSGPPSSVMIRVDYGNQVIEGNEGNNFLELLFTPPPSCTAKQPISP